MKKYNMWIYYIISIILHLMLLPFLFWDKNGNVALIEMFIGTVITPIFLIAISTKYLNDFNIYKFFIILVEMLFVGVIGIAVEYFNWGVTTGNLLQPDSETILIIKLQMIISSITIIVGWCIVAIIKKRW